MEEGKGRGRKGRNLAWLGVKEADGYNFIVKPNERSIVSACVASGLILGRTYAGPSQRLFLLHPPPKHLPALPPPLRLGKTQRIPLAMQLVLSAELFRIKEDRSTLLINYNQPTVSILVYG